MDITKSKSHIRISYPDSDTYHDTAHFPGAKMCCVKIITQLTNFPAIRFPLAFYSVCACVYVCVCAYVDLHGLQSEQSTKKHKLKSTQATRQTTTKTTTTRRLGQTCSVLQCTRLDSFWWILGPEVEKHLCFREQVKVQMEPVTGDTIN